MQKKKICVQQTISRKADEKTTRWKDEDAPQSYT